MQYDYAVIHPGHQKTKRSQTDKNFCIGEEGERKEKKRLKKKIQIFFFVYGFKFWLILNLSGN